MLPYTSGSRLPNKFKLGPFIIIIFMGKYISVKIGINSLTECLVLGKNSTF
jgi:hypothetical protein